MHSRCRTVYICWDSMWLKFAKSAFFKGTFRFQSAVCRGNCVNLVCQSWFSWTRRLLVVTGDFFFFFWNISHHHQKLPSRWSTGLSFAVSGYFFFFFFFILSLILTSVSRHSEMQGSRQPVSHSLAWKTCWTLSQQEKADHKKNWHRVSRML